uniref:Peptidase_M13 domain-containing protein n=1 Tax=Strongyloides papillosus TaxID=174720 RepID=A0A0N5C7V8_STREA
MNVLTLIFCFFTLLLTSKGFVTNDTTNYNQQLTSKSLHEFVDLNLDPCDNFYKFSCGNWIKTKELERGNNEIFGYHSSSTNFDNFIKEFLAGKLNDESIVIKKIYNIRKKCEELSGNEIKKCEDKILRFGIYALISLFIRKNRIDSEKHGDYIILEDMIKRFKEEFRILIDEKKDMFDNESRDSFLKKLIEMEFTKKLDEDHFSSVLLMEACYKDLKVSENDSIENVLKNIELLSEQNYTIESCGDKIFKFEKYLGHFAHKNAFYQRFYNKFGISASALKEHWFSRYFPHALNYGGVGFVITHEISHAFDDRNYKLIYDADEKGRLIVTPESIKNFEKKVECFVKQYDVQKENTTNKNVNGLLTLTENIADNSGLKIAHRAYMKYLQSIGGEEPKVPGFENFTSEQLFFISVGRTFCEHKSKFYKEQEMKDPHTPPEIRINVALSNYKPFSSAFKCGTNSKMNPEGKCELWKNH